MRERFSPLPEGLIKEQKEKPAKVHLILVRHGETPYNIKGQERFQGKSDIPLTETGAGQAVEVSKKLAQMDYDVIISGTLERQMKSAELATGREPLQDPRLHEVDVGELAGMTRKQAGPERMQNIKKFDYFALGGESKKDVDKRLKGFVNDILERYPGKTVLIFTSSNVVRWIINEYGNEPNPDVSVGSVHEVDISKKQESEN